MMRTITSFTALATSTIALIVAGCGGSGSGSSYSSAPYGSTAPTGVRGASDVKVASSSLGRIVVDGSGRTLYLFEKDKNPRSACYGQCAKYWPPLLTRGAPLARAGAEQSLLGTTIRTNGGKQVTYAGHPLYRFVADTAAGQTNGEGIRDFGAGWDVLSPAGGKIEADG
jgi:predicted lipoprotein with Yx(FWY)xxD motif